MRVITAVALAAATALIGVTTSAASSASAAPAAAQADTAAPAALRADTAAPTALRAAAPVYDVLQGVSCLTSKNCLAVGGDLGVDALAETWNGTAWHAVRVKQPAGSTNAYFDAAATAGTSGTHFVAVGSFSPKGSPYSWAFAGSWNGKAWTPSIPPGGGISQLSAVSCISSENCLAVGTLATLEGGYGGGIADSWNGAEWTWLTPPVPIRAGVGDVLNGVSCVAGPFCVAVGLSFSGKPLIFSWNGSSWKTLKAATVKGVSKLSLDSVSCTSASSCVAVGDGVGQPGDVAEVWNGTTWTATGRIAWPEGATNPRVYSVSCATVGYCVAVGVIDQNPKSGFPGTGRAAASHWNGKTWAATVVAAPGKNNISSFNAVTCLRATFCAAVGQTGRYESASSTGLSGFWNGKTWHLVTAK